MDVINAINAICSSTDKPIVIYLIGLPGSNKSEYAKTLSSKLSRTFEIIDSKSVRKDIVSAKEYDPDSNALVRSIMVNRIDTCLDYNQSVIIDSNCLDNRTRENGIELCRKYDAIIIGLVFIVPFPYCKNKSPDIPDRIMTILDNKFTKHNPTILEGFDALYSITLDNIIDQT